MFEVRVIATVQHVVLLLVAVDPCQNLILHHRVALIKTGFEALKVVIEHLVTDWSDQQIGIKLDAMFQVLDELALVNQTVGEVVRRVHFRAFN